MKEIFVDVATGSVKTITATEQDNLNETYKIILKKNEARVDLTDKNVKMILINEKIKFSTVLDLPIIDAKSGELKLQITDKITFKSGILNCQLGILGENGFLENTGHLSIYVKESLFVKFTELITSKWNFGDVNKIIEDAKKFGSEFPNWEAFLNQVKKNEDERIEAEKRRDKKIEDINSQCTNIKSYTKEINNLITLSENNFSNRTEQTINGSLVNANYSMIDDYIAMEVEFDQSQHPSAVLFELPILAKEVGKVIVNVKFEDMKRPFIAVGGYFNWSQMDVKDVDSLKEYEFCFDGENSPVDGDSIYNVFVGTRGGDTAIKCKIKYSYYKKSNSKSKSDLSLFALNSTNALYAKKAIKSGDSDFANYSKNSGAKPFTYDSLSFNNEGMRIIDNNFSYILEKPKGVKTNYFYCFYLKITYKNIEELNKLLIFNFKNITGIAPTQAFIVKNNTDWNPVNRPISVDINNPINIYKSIMGKNEDFINEYKELEQLYVLIGYEYKSADVATNSESKAEITPFILDQNSVVVATYLEENLENEIYNKTFKNVVNNINEIPIGLRIVNFDDYIVRNNNDAFPIVISQKGSYVNVRKSIEGIGSQYGGVYIKFEYSDFENLDGDMIIEYHNNSKDIHLTTCILYDITDWGSPSNQGTVSYVLNEPFNLKKLLDNSGMDYANKNKLYFTVLTYNPNGVSTTFDFNVKATFRPNSIDVCASSLTGELKQELINTIKKSEEYITCWGDSLTAGGGWTTTLSKNLKMTVYNGGTGGENSSTIMARQGGDIMVVNNITIPNDRTPVTIAVRESDIGISTFFNKKVTPLLQGGSSHINPCFIGDVEGTLTWTGSSYNDMSGSWTFTRNHVGEETIINRPTALRTNFDINKNSPRIMILFIGQNGGYDNIEHLIQQHRLMIEHSKCDNFIVLGLSSGTASDRKEYEDSMRKEFGRRFISLREYLSTYGLDDAGIEPTEQDLLMMAEGRTPQSLLTDTVHYNEACKVVIGNMITKKIRELNMI